MQTEIQNPQISENSDNPGCLSEAGWLLGGAALPMASLTFYRKAAQKSVGSALLFFFIFTIVIAIATSIGVGLTLFSAMDNIEEAYASGSIPEITISGGVAQVDAGQPFVLFDEYNNQGQRLLVMTDTSGKVTSIDRSVYVQGFLLTKTELHILNRGDYQRVNLRDLNASFEKDPILINAETVKQAWSAFSVLIVIIVFIGLVIWHSIIRLMIVATLALVVWGIVSLFRNNTNYGSIIITGLYALIPAIYISRLFSRASLTFPGLQTFFLFVFWVIGLLACFVDHPFFKKERASRLWTGLVAAPMLLLFIVDMMWRLPDPYGNISIWVVTLLTFIVLAATRLFFRFRDDQPADAPLP